MPFEKGETLGEHQETSRDRYRQRFGRSCCITCKKKNVERDLSVGRGHVCSDFPLRSQEILEK